MIITEAGWSTELPAAHREAVLAKLEELLGDEFEYYNNLATFRTDQDPVVVIRFWPSVELAEQWNEYILTLANPSVIGVRVIID